jgi:hypothetical protein
MEITVEDFQNGGKTAENFAESSKPIDGLAI